MRKIIVSLLAITITAACVENAVAANRKNVNPNYGYCKSGKKVEDTKQCKENGGKL